MSWRKDANRTVHYNITEVHQETCQSCQQTYTVDHTGQIHYCPESEFESHQQLITAINGLTAAIRALGGK